MGTHEITFLKRRNLTDLNSDEPLACLSPRDQKATHDKDVTFRTEHGRENCVSLRLKGILLSQELQP